MQDNLIHGLTSSEWQDFTTMPPVSQMDRETLARYQRLVKKIKVVE